MRKFLETLSYIYLILFFLLGFGAIIFSGNIEEEVEEEDMSDYGVEKKEASKEYNKMIEYYKNDMY